MAEAILGISAYYHDSAAALLVDGQLVAAAQEERFTRCKHDPSFPSRAVAYVLDEAGLAASDLTAVCFYDKPFLKFERLLETYHSFAPHGLGSFIAAMPVWAKDKLFLRQSLRREMLKLGHGSPRLLFPEHHLSHAASAFYPSPFEEAAILTLDGVGEWTTTSIGHGRGNSLTVLRELDFPHSLGLLYSAFTHYCGFRVNDGEYKLMGLAPYGDSAAQQTREWKRLILERMVDLREDGSLLLNLDYFAFTTELAMCRDRAWESLFGLPRRSPDDELTLSHANLAMAIQEVIEEAVLRLARTATQLTGCRHLVMAGGVALNCVANSKLLNSGIVDELWVQPAAGDAGGAVGAAYAGWHIWRGRERLVTAGSDAMQGAFLGPDFDQSAMERVARRHHAKGCRYRDSSALYRETARLLAEGKVVGWFQGRMEYGPRALGNRSILADPRQPEMQRRLNQKIKFRESFRPFAPAVLAEAVSEYFQFSGASPYMLLVAQVAPEQAVALPLEYQQLGMSERLHTCRSNIPAVTHVDFSARLQTVDRTNNERFWSLLTAFRELTGCAVLVNTSFNVKDEPIVCTPEDAWSCFINTDIDCLVMGESLFIKDGSTSG